MKADHNVVIIRILWKMLHAESPRVAAKPLSLLPLVFLIFFEVSGGPFGTEVRTGCNTGMHACHDWGQTNKGLGLKLNLHVGCGQCSRTFALYYRLHHVPLDLVSTWSTDDCWASDCVPWEQRLCCMGDSSLRTHVGVPGASFVWLVMLSVWGLIPVVFVFTGGFLVMAIRSDRQWVRQARLWIVFLILKLALFESGSIWS